MASLPSQQVNAAIADPPDPVVAAPLAAPVNTVIQKLANRLKRKDPTLSQVLSLRRLPVTEISPLEVIHILQALLEASCTTKQQQMQQQIMLQQQQQQQATTTTTTTTTTTSSSTSSSSTNNENVTDTYDNNNNDDDDDESLSCPISTLQMWLPDHPSNNNSNNNNSSHSSISSNVLMNSSGDYSSSWNSSFTDSNDDDFLLKVDNNNANNNNNSMNMNINNHDSVQSMDWDFERGNASGIMNIVEEEEVEHDDDEHENEQQQQHDDDENSEDVMVDPLEQQHALETASVQPLSQVLQPQQQPPQQPPPAQVPQHHPQGRRLPPPDYSIITPVLASNTSITTLAVSSAPSTAAWKAIFCGIGQNTSITTLELGDSCLIADPCTLETDACKALAEHVLLLPQRKKRTRNRGSSSGNNNNDNKTIASSSTSSSIKHLVLRSFSLPCQGVEYLARGIENSKSNLESIELQQIETDPGSFGRILESLASPSSHVKSLILVDCDLGIDMLLDDHPLTLLLTTSRTLEILRMTECQVTSVELQAMAAASTPSPALLNSASSGLPPPLKVLDLRGNDLGNDAAPALAELLDKQTSLEKLILEDNQLGDEVMITDLAKPLSRHVSLRKLNLRGNNLSSKSVNRALILPVSLKILDISENHLGGSGGASSSSSPSSSNSNNRNRTITSDWAGFFQANSHRTTSWSLILEATSLTDTDLVHLCQGLSQSPTCALQSLNVGQNHFGTSGMQAITNLLLSSSSIATTTTKSAVVTLRIQSLNLSSCQLSDADIAILAPGLTRCPSLRQVYLGFNQIDNAGCQSLGLVIAEKTCHFQELQLQFNPFGVVGLSHLVQGVKQNNRLLHVSVLKDSAAVADRVLTKQLEQEMVHWLSLNRAGRQLLSCSCSVPAAIWPTILTRAGKVYGPTGCYYLLQEEQSSRVASY